MTLGGPEGDAGDQALPFGQMLEVALVLVPISVLAAAPEVVDARVKPAHDEVAFNPIDLPFNFIDLSPRQNVLGKRSPAVSRSP